ncbi:MAG: MAPEG family protein [Burkholderiales bacterium]|nr:MAPEG family protein [Burkholderiales bacterium]
MHAPTDLLYPLLALIILSLIVGLRMLFCRVREMRGKRIHPQAAANSVQMAARLEDVLAADNFRNLFETPVMFYALCAIALAAHFVPEWLVVGSWTYVALRYIHSYIHCSYNKVMHRLSVFLLSFALLVGMWFAFVLSLPRA